MIPAERDSPPPVATARRGSGIAGPGNRSRPSCRTGVLFFVSLFGADGRLLATGSFDGTARIWDARTGLALTPPIVHQDTVICVAFSPDGSRLATSSADGTARIWDVATGRPVSAPLEHKDEVLQVVYSPDGRMLATASKDGTARHLGRLPPARPSFRRSFTTRK